MNNILIARFQGVASLVAPQMTGRFEAALNAVIRHERAEALLTAQAMAADEFWPSSDNWRAAYRPYVVRDGVLHIPVKGVLLHDFPWALGSWATGYIYIARALERGLADMNVRAIAFVCDSYGGEVAGCFELVDRIYAARGQKPMRSFAHEHAYSAGYAVASAPDHVAMSRTGGVGSIGVVTTHVDVSEAMKDMGVKITFVFAGKHKVDGNAYQPLPDEVKQRWQARIDSLYGIFTASVARNRGIDEKAVRATEADCFGAEEAIEIGLADSIGPFDDCVAAFNQDLSTADEEGEEDMSEKTASATDATNQQAIDQARTEGHAAGKAEGIKETKKSERARISAIVGSEEAKGREELAQHLAFETDMEADAAKAMLTKAPKAAEVPKASRLENVPNPKVEATEAAQGDDVVKASAAVAAFLGRPRAAA